MRATEYHTIIIGAGIFGQVIAKALRKRSPNMRVLVLDDRHVYRGSDPAACLMKPSWYSSLGKEVHEPALAMLRELYDVQDIEFAAGLKMLKTKVHWINPADILHDQDPTRAFVQKISRRGGHYLVHVAPEQEPYSTHRVIVAAGVWTNELLGSSHDENGLCTFGSVEGASSQAGVSFIFKGQIDQPIISPWAPYRQIVAFNINQFEIWVGDGTVKKDEMLSPDKIQECLRRCAKLIGRDPEDETIEILKGFRPYVKDAKPCYLKEHLPGLWVVTGGAKNGTLAAGWAAHKLTEEMP